VDEDEEDDEWEDVDEDDGEELVDKPPGEIDYKTVILNPNVKMKRFDEFGFPLDDGYDYS
jgi:hypothetical protein